MNDKGKVKDVLVEPVFYTDEATGVRMPSHALTIWADTNKKDLIAKVEGVANVFCVVSPTEYNVYLDHRYDVDFVSKEIEAVLLCEGE
jgi:hypothetical protein